ncbi:vWA domain-containing protein [Desulfitobacterium chlororespirans]|uniref:Ca-activated chloride channel family protein n=1 Tax=Desulfitobacterium chlororespirans DSM 11544 TaxID=1121395 RepID=A0A1M7TAN4_9FIRM|nr:vWA domain-containing protein [Desulfitobacterium chlororespirans]SHN67792.1 Ca-activated chloride channel family protein [Desulfitobacterium chlororespirans DSM 11544]
MEELIQFSEKDKIFVIPFGYVPEKVYSIQSAADAEALISGIKGATKRFGADICEPVELAIEILNDVDSEIYTKSIILITNGLSRDGKFSPDISYDIPVFSIVSSYQIPEQLDEISRLTGGKVFNEDTDIIDAFKEIRGYN